MVGKMSAFSSLEMLKTCKLWWYIKISFKSLFFLCYLLGCIGIYIYICIKDMCTSVGIQYGIIVIDICDLK